MNHPGFQHGLPMAKGRPEPLQAVIEPQPEIVNFVFPGLSPLIQLSQSVIQGFHHTALMVDHSQMQLSRVPASSS